MADVIDTLADIAPGSALDAIRAQRPQARIHAQATYDSLFKPASEADASKRERFAVALFVARLHGKQEMTGHYGKFLEADPELQEAVRMAAAAAGSEGPYGHFPKGPLSAEDKPGAAYRIASPVRDQLGARIAAALEHTHMLVYHPRDASPAHLQALIDAAWSTTGIVVISQLVAFLSYQIRVVTGLRVLQARPR
jgi:CMD domain protein